MYFSIRFFGDEVDADVCFPDTSANLEPKLTRVSPSGDVEKYDLTALPWTKSLFPSSECGIITQPVE